MIAEANYADHVATHRKLKPDGQLTDYMTLPQDEREGGDLAGVPSKYLHKKCGAITDMPEEIIRSYLKNPYLYLADETFCTGCGTHVANTECHWIETGVTLQTYMETLRSKKPEFRPNPLVRMVMAFRKKIR